MAIEINELIGDDGTTEILEITGASSLEDAQDAAIAWCEEYNCLLLETKPTSKSESFSAKVCSDDYSDETNFTAS